MAAARGFVLELFRISNEVAFADHVTKCCILIGRAKNVLIIYAESGECGGECSGEWCKGVGGEWHINIL